MRGRKKSRDDDVRRAFEKFVPSKVVERALSSPESLTDPETRIAAILVCDVQAFTLLSEALTPDQLLGQLNEYLEIVGTEVERNHGLIMQYIGDSVVAVFSAPACENPAGSAVKVAHSVLEKLAHRSWPVAFGISYGVVSFSCIGYSGRLQYSVVGDSVNLASRTAGPH